MDVGNVDDNEPAANAESPGALTQRDTGTEPSHEMSARLRRARALAELGAMADRGDFDEFVGNPTAYRL